MQLIDYTEAVRHAPAFDGHERVSLIKDQESGLTALIAIHNTNLGPAVGGCRMFDYASLDDAVHDVLRLSRGMTYKSAVAGLPMGGGKAVILGDPKESKSPKLLSKMGEFIQAHNGQYVTAEDSGMSVSDLEIMSLKTKHVLGVSKEQEFGGDPSPLTAMGIFIGIEAAVSFKLGKPNLHGVHVAIQGAGAVGRYLIKQLIAAGAIVSVADINSENVNLAHQLGAQIVGLDEIFTVSADVFCPCAMGGILNDETIKMLTSRIIAGGANNQLALPRHANQLKQRDILYAPDFVINAGGIIEICRQFQNEAVAAAHAKISNIGKTLSEIFAESTQTGNTTAEVAEQIAERRFKSPAIRSDAA